MKIICKLTVPIGVIPVDTVLFVSVSTERTKGLIYKLWNTRREFCLLLIDSHLTYFNEIWAEYHYLDQESVKQSSLIRVTRNQIEIMDISNDE